MKNQLYPLRFEPILKQKIWGGKKLKSMLNKSSDAPDVGESWELSDVKGDTSIVANGNLKGQSLKKLLIDYGADLLGKKNHERFGENFPLLIKFIDAKTDLSIQLHPGDELAKARHDSFGKTEMWYVMQADKDAKLIVGFNRDMDAKTYLKHLEEKTLPEILNFDTVKTGDTYFIESGRIHAIGGGVLLAEIQQTSDITYRVYDWDRTDDDGNERELHNDIAIDAFDFDMPDNYRIDYKSLVNQSNTMVSCPYFTTNIIELNGTLPKDKERDSFIIYMCVEGSATIVTENHSETLETGQTLLLPASVGAYRLTANESKLLEIYID